MEKTVSEAIAYRRAVRVFKEEPIDTQKVEQCLKNATLAATSSNLQLWEFYHITNPEIIRRIAVACFNQNASKTAKQLVVVVARKDLWRQRARANLKFIEEGFNNTEMTPRLEKRRKMAQNYYGKLIPVTYFDFLGIFGWLKFLAFQLVGLFRPIYRQARTSDMRVVAHKSAGLAAQNFMISMASIGYDTCPMEGSDTLRVKRILKIPYRAEINMVIGCGIRDEKGIYGPRFRIPFKEVYRLIN
ncbi:MAG: nitroreductase family protein [Bacteroidia bacterium]|nr:nitroreductase family protein [Bacteroidia bacterium]NNF29976.1 nitroreductase family protein [Flavobacteriaceae bacterium]MBT8276044.1 nitroreductase family protein [Bacteroidia bacterium]NNJ80873.1 nitroreductase family protein [Flavobacteriaceae bacterium]NNK53681.1 nitroreductase family protein [Flavobacteriaceae bacterium]